MHAQNQEIKLQLLTEKRVTLYIKREDLSHPIISGNKFRKLKYNLVEAKKEGHDTLLTFGGPYSNHIAATAFAGRTSGLKTIGLIRGQENAVNYREHTTLGPAFEHGMRFKFVSRNDYRRKKDPSFLDDLEREFGRYYLLPEGGTNALAVKGCTEILEASDATFDIVCCPVGTGGTLAGIINSTTDDQQVLGFSALKGDFLREDIRKFAIKNNWDLMTEYHFGRFAKVSAELVEFINYFKRETKIQLDPVYTAKMVFGILDLIENDKFRPGTRILAVHTGGLQGIAGINRILKMKNEPLIAICQGN